MLFVLRSGYNGSSTLGRCLTILLQYVRSEEVADT